jgi:hypothetical protein
MNLDECLSYLQAHAFYITCIMIVGYLIYHSTPCTTLRHKFHYTISQNPVRVAKYEQKRKEIRLQQAIQFEKDLEDKRQERKKNVYQQTLFFNLQTTQKKALRFTGLQSLDRNWCGWFQFFQTSIQKEKWWMILKMFWSLRWCEKLPMLQ